jgi:hypothetical protein
MKRFIVFSCVCLLSVFTLGCQRDRGVRAGSEEGEYMPRPAPKIEDHEVQGELLGINSRRETIQVRLENGMVQTFKFDDSTVVQGLPKQQSKSGKATDASGDMRSLTGKEGSEVTIQWIDDSGAKLATHIQVTQLNGERR